MKRKNFPGRKNKRRVTALNHAIASNNVVLMDILEDKIISHREAIKTRTKKFRG